MKVAASEFKARCLSLIDAVHEVGKSITITKRGRVVACLVPAGDFDDQPRQRVRGKARWRADPLAPALDEDEIAALR